MQQDTLNLLAHVPAPISFMQRARFLVTQMVDTLMTVKLYRFHNKLISLPTMDLSETEEPLFVRLTVFSFLAIIFSHFCLSNESAV